MYITENGVVKLRRWRTCMKYTCFFTSLHTNVDSNQTNRAEHRHHRVDNNNSAKFVTISYKSYFVATEAFSSFIKFQVECLIMISGIDTNMHLRNGLHLGFTKIKWSRSAFFRRPRRYARRNTPNKNAKPYTSPKVENELNLGQTDRQIAW